MLPSAIRKTLETYLGEKRIITTAQFDSDELTALKKKDALFVTLYHQGKIIASQGRIQCKKENTLLEAIDLAFMCLKEKRFEAGIQTLEALKKMKIRVDIITPQARRMISIPSEMHVRNEGMMILSQNYGVLAVLLPHMIEEEPTPEKYFDIVCQKAGLERDKLKKNDYVLYALTTIQEDDFM